MWSRCGQAVKDENAEILVVAAKTEADIAELETYEDRQMFLREIGLEESGVSRPHQVGLQAAQP